MSTFTRRPRTRQMIQGGLRTHLLTVLLFVATLIVLRPTMVGQWGALNRLFQGAAVALLLVLVVAAVLLKVRLRGYLLCFLALRGIGAFTTLYNDGDFASWSYYSIVPVCLFLLFETTRTHSRATVMLFIHVLNCVLIGYLAINLITIYSGTFVISEWVSGFSQATYFLGIRTRITDIVFPAILVAQISDRERGRVLGPSTIAVAILAIWQLVTLQVATAVVGFVAAGLVYLLVRFAPRRAPKLTAHGLTILGALLSAVFVLGRIETWPVIADFVRGTLGKSVTLTGRTEIWAEALPLIAERRWFGHGVDNNFGAFVPWLPGTLWQAHNQYLQMAYDFGIIGVLLFVVFLLVAFRPVDRISNKQGSTAVLLACYAAFMVMFVSEIYTYNMGLFYILPAVAASWSHVVERDRSPLKRGSL